MCRSSRLILLELYGRFKWIISIFFFCFDKPSCVSLCHAVEKDGWENTTEIFGGVYGVCLRQHWGPYHVRTKRRFKAMRIVMEDGDRKCSTALFTRTGGSSSWRLQGVGIVCGLWGTGPYEDEARTPRQCRTELCILPCRMSVGSWPSAPI